MQEKLAELQLFADAFGIASDMQSFSSRLLVQKKIYFLQMFGIDLGFRYGWYIRGPYCPSLTKRFYELEEHQEYKEQIMRKYELRIDVRQKVADFANKYMQMLERIPNGSEADKAELLVSIHYIRNREMPHEKKEKVIEELISRKDWYSSEEALLGWEILSEHGLIC